MAVSGTQSRPTGKEELNSSSLLAESEAFIQEWINLLKDHIKLANLELRSIVKTCITVIVYSLFYAFILSSIWFFLSGMGFVYLQDTGLSIISSLLILILVNIVIALILRLIILKQLKKIKITLGMIQPDTKPQPIKKPRRVK